MAKNLFPWFLSGVFRANTIIDLRDLGSEIRTGKITVGSGK